MQKGDKEKWTQAFKNYNEWDDESARKVQEKEAKVIIGWLKDLNLSNYKILEIGCGNGYVGKIIVTELAKQGASVSYTFADIVPECLEVAKRNTQNIMSQANVNFQPLDVFEADKTLGEKSQDIIISTGYSSAATYLDAVPVVSRILKTDGVLICDFVNHFSPLLFISKFPKSLTRLFKTLKQKNMYHFGSIGINKHFSSNGLKKIKSKTIRIRRNPLLCMFRKI